MADRQMRFTAPEIRALLDGKKTQARRVLKPQPYFNHGGPILDAAGGHMDYIEPHWSPEPRHPYAPGDRLWVREACAVDGDRVFYRLDHDEAAGRGPRVDVRWRPSIHMPRWASRLTLIVTDVRVQRLQDISEDDARAEGVAPVWSGNMSEGPSKFADEVFADLWGEINGPGAWEANPWVVALTFTVHRRNIDQMEAAQ